MLQLNRKKVSKVKKEIHKIQRRFAPQVDVTGVTTDLLPFFAPFNFKCFKGNECMYVRIVSAYFHLILFITVSQTI